MGSIEATSIKMIQPAQRGILYLASALVLIMGMILFLLADDTATYFAWTIDVPLTAAFLGGTYLASFFLEFLAARETTWGKARVAMPAALMFTGFTTYVTFLHLDKFHLSATNPVTVIITWAWILVYALVPAAFVLIFIAQLRAKGSDPARLHPLPNWYKITMGIQGAAMLLIGFAGIIVPATMVALWIWDLTLLTAGAMGAWFIGLGTAAIHSVIEDDWSRLRPAIGSYLVFGVLQLINVIRYPDAAGLDWSAVSTWAYVGFLLSVVVIAGYGLMMNRRAHTA